MTVRTEQKLAKMGISLPAVAAPVANYVGWTVSGKTVYVSGQLPTENGKLTHSGHLGAELTAEQGAEAARQCAINILAQLKNACDTLVPAKGLDAVTKTLKLEGLVSASPEFKDHPKVINGASDLMVDVFGDAGKHARVAFGVASLPVGAAVEVAGIFELDI